MTTINDRAMRTVTIDILNEKAALNLLQDLELLELIRLHKGETMQAATATSWAKHKGAMLKQALRDIDQQLEQLRNEWE